MYRLLQNISLLITLIILILACKEESETIPIVNIMKPFDGQEFNVLDTIVVSGTANDDKGINKISISLTDNNLVNLLPPVTINVNNKEKVVFNELYPVDDIQLSSGYYYIVITAKDNFATARKYRSIRLREVPLELEKIIAVTQPNEKNTEINEFDLLLNKKKLLHINCPCFLSDISSKYHQLYFISDNDPEHLYCYNMNDLSIEWESEPGIPFPYYSALYTNELVYAGTENGTLYGYNQSGTVRYSIVAKEDTIPENIVLCGNYIVTDNRLTLGQEHYIVIYHCNTGAYMKRKLIDFDIVYFIPINNNCLFVLGNKHNGIVAGKYYLSENYFEHLSQNTGKAIDVDSVSKDELVVATNNGIYSYQTNNGNFNQLPISYFPKYIEYDEIYNILVCGNENTLKIYSYSNNSKLADVYLNAQLKNIHLLYNK